MPIMGDAAAAQRQHFEELSRADLRDIQLTRLNALLATVRSDNPFYAEKLAGVKLPLRALDQLAELPFTTKAELMDAPQGDGFGANRTYALDQYTRFHQTSGTRGEPLSVVDTRDDWRWWIDCWQYVLDAGEIDASDRAMLAFSFGPFIGFWSAHDALVFRGALVVPGGGMSTVARLQLLRKSGATILLCTPTYALRMAEVAAQHAMDLTTLPVRRIVVAGEPGGSLPAVRARIDQAWKASVIDHAGATEVGAWGYGDTEGDGLYVNEYEFVVELIEPESGAPAAYGTTAELVLTPLGRFGAPVIRYRTGDMVRATLDRPGRRRFVFLEGGVLGRADDMITVRGVNVFPSALDQILRSFSTVDEYRIFATRQGELDALSVEVEDRAEQPDRIAQCIETKVGLSVVVRNVPAGSLPRFEAKAKRFIDQREQR